MPRIDYSSDELRLSGRHASAAATAAGTARAALAGAGAANPFGDVGGAAALHEAVLHARTQHDLGTRSAAVSLDSQARRAADAATVGDHLDTETTALSCTPGIGCPGSGGH